MEAENNVSTPQKRYDHYYKIHYLGRPNDQIDEKVSVFSPSYDPCHFL